MSNQQYLVKQFLNWDRVADRLRKFSNIREHYEDQILQGCCDKPPYYCHYMAWRLGTWHNENLFHIFDKLLARASQLQNWEEEFKSFKASCEFGKYWSLLWQLQVAHFFSCHSPASWNSSGPDLTVETDEGKLYVECYTYQKSFGLEDFVSELFRHLDKAIRVNHRYYMPFSLPHGNDIGVFLDELFRPYRDPSFLKAKRREAQVKWPVLLPVPSSVENFQVYLEGPSKAYDPDVIPNYSGIPDNYLSDAIEKGVAKKAEENKLSEHRPNVVAINYLLSSDFQGARTRQQALRDHPPNINFGEWCDAIIMVACGIDEELSLSQLEVSIKQEPHPIMLYVR